MRESGGWRMTLNNSIYSCDIVENFNIYNAKRNMMGYGNAHTNSKKINSYRTVAASASTHSDD